MQLMEEEVPLDESQLSPELADFVRRCMHKDPWQRPSAEQLMRHPFIRKVGGHKEWSGGG
jgi:serine/threonine protein kinase